MRNLTVLAVLAASAAASADVIFVPKDRPTIQQAIALSGSGDEIVVADGTYVDSLDTGGKSVTIRSASADPASVTIVGNEQFAIYVDSSETATFQDVTIRNPTEDGHGIFVDNGSALVLQGCRLHAVAGSGPFQGGLVHVRGASSIIAEDTVFENVFQALLGGGVGIISGSGSFTNCVFQNLVAILQGGAVQLFDAGATFTGCSFISNFASSRGGAIYAAAPITVIDCEFRSNFSDKGGAIFDATDSIVIENTAFRENTAVTGGALWLNDDYELTNCAFLCNVADVDGGALFVGSAFPPGEMISNCFFGLNEAENGGGILSLASSAFGPEISDTTLCGNHIGQIKGGWVDVGGNDVNTFCVADPPIDCDTDWPFSSLACPADVDGNDRVDADDLVLLMLVWGTSDQRADLDDDGVVGADDLTILILNWGCA
jgi:predicted outer membrane repeat protein